MSNISTPSPLPIAGDPLTERVRATWTAGDFGRIAQGYEHGAAEFVARLELTPGERVLDVASGTGNLALPAARGGARVTALDISPNLLGQLAARAALEGLRIAIDEGNCEALPYPDGSFDTVMSIFGAMFAARPDRAAAELVRVCRPGGRIAMANWTPTSFIGDMLKATVGFVPPPAGVPSPLLWGDEATVRERLGALVSPRFTHRTMTFEYPLGPAEVVDHFRTWYGPTKRAFDALDTAAADELRRRLVALWSENNRASDGTTRVESEYLEVVAVRI
jgi:SAM-dependent methyltransferase